LPQLTASDPLDSTFDHFLPHRHPDAAVQR